MLLGLVQVSRAKILLCQVEGQSIASAGFPALVHLVKLAYKVHAVLTDHFKALLEVCNWILLTA